MQNVSFADFHSDFEKNLNYFTSKAEKLTYLGRVAETADLAMLDLKVAFSFVFAEVAKNLPVAFSQDNLNRIEIFEDIIRRSWKSSFYSNGNHYSQCFVHSICKFYCTYRSCYCCSKSISICSYFWMGWKRHFRNLKGIGKYIKDIGKNCKGYLLKISER